MLCTIFPAVRLNQFRVRVFPEARKLMSFTFTRTVEASPEEICREARRLLLVINKDSGEERKTLDSWWHSLPDKERERIRTACEWGASVDSIGKAENPSDHPCAKLGIPDSFKQIMGDRAEVVADIKANAIRTECSGVIKPEEVSEDNPIEDTSEDPQEKLAYAAKRVADILKEEAFERVVQADDTPHNYRIEEDYGVKYERFCIRRQENIGPTALCKELNISPKTYYKWDAKRKEVEAANANKLQEIQEQPEVSPIKPITTGRQEMWNPGQAYDLFLDETRARPPMTKPDKELCAFFLGQMYGRFKHARFTLQDVMNRTKYSNSVCDRILQTLVTHKVIETCDEGKTEYWRIIPVSM